jgi:hypothetical protein
MGYVKRLRPPPVHSGDRNLTNDREEARCRLASNIHPSTLLSTVAAAVRFSHDRPRHCRIAACRLGLELLGRATAVARRAGGATAKRVTKQKTYRAIRIDPAETNPMPTDQQRDPIHTNKNIRRTAFMAYVDDERSWESSTPVLTAPVFVHEDDVTVNIQIELADNHAMLISVRKDQDLPPVLTLWHGSGEHNLPPEHWHALRAWFAEATTTRSEKVNQEKTTR